MTTLFKAITRTTPRAINQNSPVAAPSVESYTQLMIRDLLVEGLGLYVTLTAKVVKSKSWADKNALRCEDLAAIIAGTQGFNGDLEILAERMAAECLSYESVCDVTIRIENRNIAGNIGAMGVEIYRQQ